MSAPARNLAWWVRHHFERIWWGSFAVWLAPALWLVALMWSGAGATKPQFTAWLHQSLNLSGRWALIMLLITLAVTPARRFSVKLAQFVHARFGRRLSDWNWLIKLRRQFGLFCFFYAAAHWLLYFVFDARADWGTFGRDIFRRPPMFTGLLALLLFAPLALTSNQASIRALGRYWRQLHSLAYPSAALALMHFWLQPPETHSSPWPYTLLLLGLLVSRVLSWQWGDRGPAQEASDRDGAPRAAPGVPERHLKA